MAAKKKAHAHRAKFSKHAKACWKEEPKDAHKSAKSRFAAVAKCVGRKFKEDKK